MQQVQDKSTPDKSYKQIQNETASRKQMRKNAKQTSLTR